MERICYILTLIPFLLISCDDEIDFPEVQEIVVVEGWLTDQDTIQYVKISRTVGYESEISGPGVQNAIVSVKSSGTSISFQHIGDGRYASDQSFAGNAGTDYWIDISISGEKIISRKEKMQIVPMLDSLGYDSFERQSEEQPQIDDIIFYPVAYFSDEATKQNYYRWRFKKNNVLFTSAENIFIQEDRFFNGLGGVKNEFIEFEFSLNDTIYAELQEITFETYNYLRLLRLQTTSLGTRSGTTPSVVQGNLFYPDNPGRLVLGYFGVISISSRNQIINP